MAKSARKRRKARALEILARLRLIDRGILDGERELRSLVSSEAWRVYLGIEELWTERLDLRLTLAQPRGSRR
jgi:hypothetical protein